MGEEKEEKIYVEREEKKKEEMTSDDVCPLSSADFHPTARH